MKFYISVLHFICLLYCSEEKSIYFDNFTKPLDSINTNSLSCEKKIIIKSIKGWQTYSYSNSFLNCQFHPSCSNYFAKAVIENGSIFGLIKGADRLVRCNVGAYYYFEYDTFESKYFYNKKNTNFVKYSDESLRKELIKIKGIGPWTIDMFLMFTMHRTDILPVGDLGIKKAFQILYKLKELPSNELMIEISAKWKPYRTIACCYLWYLVDDGDVW